MNSKIRAVIAFIIALIADIKIFIREGVYSAKKNTFSLWNAFFFCPHAGGVQIISAKFSLDEDYEHHNDSTVSSANIDFTALLTYYLHILNTDCDNHRSLEHKPTFNITKFMQYAVEQGLISAEHKDEYKLKIIWWDHRESVLNTTIIEPSKAESSNVVYNYLLGAESGDANKYSQTQNNRKKVQFRMVKFDKKFCAVWY